MDILLWLMGDVRTRWLSGFALATEAALAVRVASDLVPASRYTMMALAAALFVVGLVAWAVVAVSSLTRRC